MIWPFFLLGRARVLREIGLTGERAKLLRCRWVSIRGVVFLVRAVTPQDFLGLAEHPVAPWRQAKDRAGDKEAERRLQDEVKDPVKAQDLVEKLTRPMRNLMLKGVLYPRLSDKEEPGTVCVDDLFTDPSIVNRLIDEVAKATLGVSAQKKSLRGISSGQRRSS